MPIVRTNDPCPTCWISLWPFPATPLTPPSPPSHHNTILFSSSALCLACNHIAYPTVRSQVRAGARIKEGLDGKSMNGDGCAKSRQIDEVISMGLEPFQDLRVLFTLGPRSGISKMLGGIEEWLNRNDSATKWQRVFNCKKATLCKLKPLEETHPGQDVVCNKQDEAPVIPEI